MPPLWTVVLGEYNRAIESGYEQRIPIEKIVLHKSYQNFLHDLVLMKLSMPADLAKKSNIRRICLPFLFNEPVSDSGDEEEEEIVDDVDDPLAWGLAEVPDKMENFLRSVQTMRRYRNVTVPTMKELMDLKILNRLKRQQNGGAKQRGNRSLQTSRRRNDKIMKIFQYSNKYDGMSEEKSLHHRYVDNNHEMPYIDCVATGWGKANLTGDLTDLLLKTTVPLHNNRR